jgi:hypothetical protein
VAKELKDANVVVPCSPRKPTLHDEYEEDPLLPQSSPSRRRKKNVSYYEACVHAIERGFPELGMVCYNGEPPAGDAAKVPAGDKGKGKGKAKETKRLNPKQQRMVQDFMERVQTLREMGRTNEAGLGRMIDYIVEDVGYGAHLDKKIESESKKEEKRKKDEPTAEADPNADSRARKENLEELKRRALAFQEEALGEEEELSQEMSQQGSPLRGSQRSKTTMVSGFLRWICSQSADDDRCVPLSSPVSLPWHEVLTPEDPLLCVCAPVKPQRRQASQEEEGRRSGNHPPVQGLGVARRCDLRPLLLCFYLVFI